MTLSLFILLLTCALNGGILFFVIQKQNKKVQTLPIVVFILSIISLLLWSLCNYLADTSSSLTDALFWTRASFPAALLMGLSLVVFSYVFPIKQTYSRYIFPLYLLLVSVFSLLSMGGLIISDVALKEGVGISQVNVGILYPGILGVYLLLILHSSYNFITSYKNLTGKHRSQIKYVLLGWTTFLSIAVTTNAILPLATGNANWSKFGPLGSVLMSAAISYAILRHEFLDIKVIIQKGIIYSSLLVGVTSIYLALVFAFEIILHKSSDTSILISAFITTLIGIFGVPPLEKRFQKATDKIFFKDKYDYALVMSMLTDELNKNISLDTIVEKTSNILKQSLKAKTVTFSFKESGVIPTSSDISIHITSNKKKIGYLMLGEKLSGDNYTEEDISLLNTFTKQAGTALEKASLYKQVKEYAKNLEQKVEERTKEIMAIQKEQETLMLEISHGLQTPLTIMKGELFFLRKQGYDTEKIDTIDASIDRISAFIYRFLSLSKLETRDENKKDQIDLSQTLKGVVSFFKQETEEKNIILSSSLSEGVIMEGDKEEIEELVSNLISNSIKYTSKERPQRVKLSLTEGAHDVTIVLEDTGIGIKPENIQNLFKKFYRIKEQETKGIPGTGLGLVICKKIVDMHGGNIAVTSVFREGTTFSITLPKKQKTHK